MAYFAPTLAPSLLSSLGITATAGAIAAATAVITAAGALAAGAVSALLTSRPSAANASTPSIFRQSLANSFLIYGKRRVGGLLIFFHPRTAGKDQYRYFVVAVAGHRCRGAVRWFLGDDVVTVNGSGLVTNGTYANNAWLWLARGTDDQAANTTFVAETDGKWTAAHRGRGTTLIYAKFKMVDAVVQAGMPNITVEIEGKDDIFDPRTDTSGYTRNAQLIYRDFMAMPREEGGFGCYPDELDDDWDAAQANVCDEQVALADGGTEPRYAFDSYITTGAAPSEVRDTFVTCCAGTFTYSGGKMLMRPGYYVPSSASLQEEDLAGPINVPALLAGDQTANEVTGTYINPLALYQPADAPTRSIPSEDVRQIGIDMPHVTSGTMAQRVMEIALRKAQAERRVTWPMNIMGLAVSTLDTVQLATSRYGLSNYVFQTVGWGLSQDFSVVLQLEETGPDIFHWDSGMEVLVGQGGQLTKATPISDYTRAAHQIIRYSAEYPVTSTDATISIAAFRGTLDDGRIVDFPVAQLTGMTNAASYLVLYALNDTEQTLTGFDGAPLLGADDQPLTTTVYAGSYIAAAAPALEEASNSAFVIVRDVTTASSDGTYPPGETPPGGDGGSGVGGSGRCVTVDSLILMADGSWKLAGEMARGDRVRTQHEDTLIWGEFTVTAAEIAREAIMSADGYPDATSNHRFWTEDKGWFRMDDIGVPAGWNDVVKLTVARAHTYVARHPFAADGILSHNIKQAAAE